MAEPHNEKYWASQDSGHFANEAGLSADARSSRPFPLFLTAQIPSRHKNIIKGGKCALDGGRKFGGRRETGGRESERLWELREESGELGGIKAAEKEERGGRRRIAWAWSEQKKEGGTEGKLFM